MIPFEPLERLPKAQIVNLLDEAWTTLKDTFDVLKALETEHQILLLGDAGPKTSVIVAIHAEIVDTRSQIERLQAWISLCRTALAEKRPALVRILVDSWDPDPSV
jgi:hypothetical protein